MFNRWESWQYSATSNCWDLVRSYLSYQGVPADALPQFGITATDKKAMTRAHDQIENLFPVVPKPVKNAIACQYAGRILVHVGIVIGNKVLHTNEHGTFKSSFLEFANKYSVKYRLYHGFIECL